MAERSLVGEPVLCWGSMEAVPLEDMIPAAAAAGYKAITISPAFYVNARERGFSDAQLVDLLAQYDIRVNGIDPILSWLPDTMVLEGSDDFAIALRTSVGEALRIAQLFAAPMINLPQGLGEPVDEDQIVASFVEVCDKASACGIKVCLEFTPFSDINSLAGAWRIVAAAARDNGGLMLDCWHFFQTGIDLDLLASIPAEKIFAVQINGATATTPDQLIDAALNHRLLPGEGDCYLRPILATLSAMGVAIPFDVEVFSAELRALSPQQRATETYQASIAALAAAGIK